MKNANPKVDWYFEKAGKWEQELKLLRAIALDCNLVEVLKWGSPCYVVDDRNIVLIHTFKEYCAFLFFKGALLEDPAKILIQQTKNVQAARQIRFSDAASIKKLRARIKSYILCAIAVERSGAKVELKRVTEFTVADEFRRQLDASRALKTAFAKLTPGRQKAYLLHFSGAKRSETRTARVEKCTPRILRGLGLDD